MFKNITLGQYYPKDSLIHSLDPRVKLLGTLIYLASLFIANSFILYLPMLAFLIMVIILSKVPIAFVLRGIKPIIPLIIISAVFNIFLTASKEDIWSFGIFHLSFYGIYRAAFMAARLVLLLAGASIMTLTTSPTKLTDGCEKGLSFLTKLKVPVHEMAMMISIALRFIPILVEEMDKIKKAQMARGADFETGGIVKRAKATIPLLVPLFVSAFRRANDLAMAMEARCYNGSENRSKMYPLEYRSRDFIAYIILFALLALMILLRIFL